MWIKILKTDIGPAGAFVKGETRDVPEDVVKKLSRKGYEKCRPPWEQGRDQLVCDIEAAEAEFKKLQAAANVASDLERTARQKAKDLDAQVARLDQEVRQTKKSAKKIAELRLSKAQGYQKAAWADAELKDIEATAAGQAADKAYTKLRTFQTKKAKRDAPKVEPPAAEPEPEAPAPKPEAPAPEEKTDEQPTEQPTETNSENVDDADAAGQSKDAADAEGQTTATG